DGTPPQERRGGRRRRTEAHRRAESGHRGGAIDLRSARCRTADPAPPEAAGYGRRVRDRDDGGGVPAGHGPVRHRPRREDPEDPTGNGNPVKRAAAIAAAALIWSAAGSAQEDVLARIRQEGLERSQVQSMFATLTDEFGPRLTGTPAYKRSAEW